MRPVKEITDEIAAVGTNTSMRENMKSKTELPEDSILPLSTRIAESPISAVVLALLLLLTILVFPLLESSESATPERLQTTPVTKIDQIQPPKVNLSPLVQRNYKKTKVVLGMSEAKAVAKIKSLGLVSRITAKDGKFFAVTADYSESRVNLELNKNKVTRITIG